MRAIGYAQPGSLDRPDALIDIDLPKPVPQGRDILVRVRAVSVNPVDTKVRGGAGPLGGAGKRVWRCPYSESLLHDVFMWACRALTGLFRRFLARQSSRRCCCCKSTLALTSWEC